MVLTFSQIIDLDPSTVLAVNFYLYI